MAWNIPCSSEGRVALLSVTLRGGGGQEFLIKRQGRANTLFLEKIPKFSGPPLQEKRTFPYGKFLRMTKQKYYSKMRRQRALKWQKWFFLLETVNLKRSLQHILSNILLIQCFLFRRRGTYMHPLTRLQQRLEKTVKAYRIFYGSFPWDFCLCLCIYMVVLLVLAH